MVYEHVCGNDGGGDDNGDVHDNDDDNGDDADNEGNDGDTTVTTTATAAPSFFSSAWYFLTCGVEAHAV